MKDIIKPNKPNASVKANPRIAKTNNCCLWSGHRAVANNKPLKITPAPTPGPLKAVTAILEAISLVLLADIYRFLLW